MTIEVNAQQKLIAAIFWNNLPDVISAIENGANVNGTDFGSGTTWEKPLLWAAFNQREEITKYLIQEGAAVNVRLSDGRTPLHYAVLGQQSELIAHLISKGAEINAQDIGGCTPLHLAAEKEGPAMVTLIELGADQTIHNNAGKTAAELNHQRIQQVNAQAAVSGNTISPTFWTRLTANTGPLTPEEREPSHHHYRSLAGG